MLLRKLQLAKETFKFSSAHMSFLSQAQKEALHGHNYYVNVDLEYSTQSEDEFLDFNAVKGWVHEICEGWDEKILLATDTSRASFETVNGEVEYKAYGKRYVFPEDEVVLLNCENVIVENLAKVFSQKLKLMIENYLKSSSNSVDVHSFSVFIEETRGQRSGVTHSLN